MLSKPEPEQLQALTEGCGFILLLLWPRVQCAAMLLCFSGSDVIDHS